MYEQFAVPEKIAPRQRAETVAPATQIQTRTALRARFARQAHCAGKMVLEHFAQHQHDPASMTSFQHHLCHTIEIHYKYTQNMAMVVECAVAGHDHMLRCGPWSRWADLLTYALEAAYRLDDTKVCARLHYCMGQLNYKQSAWKNAEAQLQKAEALYQELDEPIWGPRVWHLLGAIAHKYGDLSKANGLAHKALTAQEKNGDAIGMATTCSVLGDYAREQGQIDEAIYWCQRALHIPELAEDPTTHALTHTRLGLSYHSHLEFAKSAEQHRLAQAIAEQSNDYASLSLIMSNLALIDFELGEMTAALNKLLYAETVSERCGYRLGQMFVYYNLATAYSLLEQPDIASKYSRESNDIAHQHRQNQRVAFGYVQLAQIQHQRGDYADAERLIDQAKQLRPTSSEFDTFRSFIIFTEGELAVSRRQWDKAKSYFNACYSSWKSNNNVKFLGIVLPLIIELARVALIEGDTVAMQQWLTELELRSQKHLPLLWLAKADEMQGDVAQLHQDPALAGAAYARALKHLAEPKSERHTVTRKKIQEKLDALHASTSAFP